MCTFVIHCCGLDARYENVELNLDLLCNHPALGLEASMSRPECGVWVARVPDFLCRQFQTLSQPTCNGKTTTVLPASQPSSMLGAVRVAGHSHKCMNGPEPANCQAVTVALCRHARAQCPTPPHTFAGHQPRPHCRETCTSARRWCKT